MASTSRGDSLALREELAMLVYRVYFQDLTVLGFWGAQLLGYQSVRAHNYGSTWHRFPYRPYRGGPSDADLKELGLGFLTNIPETSDSTALRYLVIALRGTIPYKLDDLKPDIRIIAGLLHKSQRVKKCQAHIETASGEFLKLEPASKEQIYLVGQSLGAGVALIIGKKLAVSIEVAGHKYKTHLFNLPLVTIASLLNGKLIPPKEKNRIYQHELNEPTGPSWFNETIGFVGVMLVKTLSSKALKREWKEFRQMHDWIPHFYLNPNDIVCHQYRNYFTRPRSRRSTGTIFDVVTKQSFLLRIFDVKSEHIGSVPSADVHEIIAYGGKYDDRLWAHSLFQWHSFSTEQLGLQVLRARLLPRPERRPSRS